MALSSILPSCTTSEERCHADGPQIASQLTDEATEAGVELGFGEVVKLTGSGPWTVETADGERHTGRAVVIATGLSKGTLGLPEEGEYDGRGLSHCASCDGPLYAGRPVVVAGAEGWAPREAAELQVVAGDVTVIGKPTPDVARRRASPRRPHRRASKAPTACSPSWSRPAARGRPFRPARYSSMSASLPLRNSCRKRLHATPPGISLSTKGAAPRQPTAFAVGDVRAGARHYLADAIADGQRAGQAIVTALKKN